jgi:ATP-binding cassette, subfamily B, bacterial
MIHSLRELQFILYFLKPYRLRVVLAAVALVIAAVTVLSFGQGLQLLIDRGFSGADPAVLNHLLILLLGLVVLAAIAVGTRFYLVTWLGERISTDIRHTVFDHVLKLSPAFFETTRTGDLLSRLTADAILLETVIGSSASLALRNLLLFIGGSVMLMVTNPKLTLLVMLGVPLVLFPIVYYGRRVRRLSRQSQDRLADVSAYADEVLHSIRTVQAFCHEEVDRARFADRLALAFATARRRIQQRALLTGLVIVLVFGSIGIVLWIGGHDVLAGRSTAGELSAFLFYAILVATSVGAISEVWGDVQRAAGAAERLVELLAVQPDIVAPLSPIPLPNPGMGALRFRRICFHYPSRPDTAALEDFSMTVEPGERLAIVGPSGAGKTTVFNLLLRFYDPQAGCITLDGIDLRAADPSEVRKRIGLVPQDPVIFGANAWENIRYGRPEAREAEVRAAAEATFATEFLEQLPQGFKSLSGKNIYDKVKG